MLPKVGERFNSTCLFFSSSDQPIKKARKRRAALRGKSYPEKKKRPKVFDIARLFEVIEDPEVSS